MKPKLTEEIVYQAVLDGELEIDAQGRVWRLASRGWDRWKGCTRLNRHERRRAENRTGKREYLQVRVMWNSRRTHAMAHRLVWRHFFGPIPPNMTVNHKNGDKVDNRPENLELATYLEQVTHARHILKRGRLDQNGSRNSMAKLSASQVGEIRSRRAQGEKLTSIAQDFGITFQTVSRIALRQRRQQA
jgi:hypothetical protein